MKRIVLLLLLVWGHGLMAQETAWSEQFRVIDSLILKHKLDKALGMCDSLYGVHQKNNVKRLPQLLELQYRKALINDEREASPLQTIQLLLGIKDEAENLKLHNLSCRIHLLLALGYEKAADSPDELQLTYHYLNKAGNLIKKHGLESVYSTYCIRRGSYTQFKKQWDSLEFYANRALKYARKYRNAKDVLDAHLLLGMVAHIKRDSAAGLRNHLLLVEFRKQTHDTYDLSAAYNNVALTYLQRKDYRKALLYADSACHYLEKSGIIRDPYPLKTRSEIFEALGRPDSALHYIKQFHAALERIQKQGEQTKSRELEHKYRLGQREAVIKNREQLLLIICSALGIIVLAWVVVMRKNMKIRNQNKIINNQLVEISRTLEQRQVILSELQHRVKNNLQHVISILEIQKESVTFNNINELIRGNQNRIHSMALLHKKLHVSEHVADVDLSRYVTELAELVKDSYESRKKKISLNIYCAVETISIDKAAPIGLIITELVSNSMKHAFKKRSIGIINIEITQDEEQKKVYYADNGVGYDFNKTTDKGLGQEIIKGLIDQLGGRIETSRDNGFELTIYFN